MFSLSVIDTDKFIDMPISARLLYYELGMRADDDGFIASPKKIVKMVGCSDGDLKSLLEKEFIICFENGVVVVTHWKLNNYIPPDRYHKTIYQKEKTQLRLSNNIYLSDENSLYTTCIQTVSDMDTQDRLGKDRLGKNNNILSTSVDGVNDINYQNVLNSFNSICVSLPKVKKLTAERKRKIKNLKKNLDNLTFDDYFTMIEQSDFLTGRNGVWNNCNFDWCMKPTNCIKIIEGNYKNKEKVVQSNLPNYEEEF